MKIGIEGNEPWVAEYYEATVVSAVDYYPFGSSMAGRKYNQGSYRYGFNGKEEDKEWGSQMIQDYGFRIYNPTIGKFLSVDPLTADYPYYTPYQFSGNMPIKFIDLDGLEPAEPELFWEPYPKLRESWKGKFQEGTIPYERTFTFTAKGYPNGKFEGTGNIKDIIVAIQYQYIYPEDKNGNAMWTSEPVEIKKIYSYYNTDKKEFIPFSPIEQNEYAEELTEFAFVGFTTTGLFVLSAGAPAYGFGLSGMSFAGDFTAQALTSDYIRNKDDGWVGDFNGFLHNDYNRVSGFSNAILRSPFAADYLGTKYNYTPAKGFTVGSTSEAITAGMIGQITDIGASKLSFDVDFGNGSFKELSTNLNNYAKYYLDYSVSTSTNILNGKFSEITNENPIIESTNNNEDE